MEEPKQDPKPIFALNPLNGCDMDEITVAEIQHHLSFGTFSSVDLTEWSLDRIKQVRSPQ
jgi:hypothetical protein